jgi:protein Mpv17
MSIQVIPNHVTRVARYVNRVIFGRSNLLLTNALISTAMGAVGDAVQQHYDLITGRMTDKKQTGDQNLVADEKFNWTRTLHMSAAGLTTGVVTHYWYILLDKKLGVLRTAKTITTKILVDQIIFSPINLAVYFSTIGVMERSTVSRVRDELIEKGMEQIYVAEWLIWPPAQFVNFYFLPLRYRILWDNLISLGFDIYSPYVKYRTELRKEKELRQKQIPDHGKCDSDRSVTPVRAFITE